MKSLPLELWQQIFFHLDPTSLGSLMSVSQKWQRASQHQKIWKSYYSELCTQKFVFKFNRTDPQDCSELQSETINKGGEPKESICDCLFERCDHCEYYRLYKNQVLVESKSTKIENLKDFENILFSLNFKANASMLFLVLYRMSPYSEPISFPVTQSPPVVRRFLSNNNFWYPENDPIRRHPMMLLMGVQQLHWGLCSRAPGFSHSSNSNNNEAQFLGVNNNSDEDSDGQQDEHSDGHSNNNSVSDDEEIWGGNDIDRNSAGGNNNSFESDRNNDNGCDDDGNYYTNTLEYIQLSFIEEPLIIRRNKKTWTWVLENESVIYESYGFFSPP